MLKKIIKAIKYKLVREAWYEVLSIIKVNQLTNFFTFARLYSDCLLQPIPLHQYKLNMRGFNQSQLLADYLHRMLHYREVNILTRSKNTLPQAQLERQKRYLNVKGAFQLQEIKPNVRNYKVILVDDVVTSGNTLFEAAKVLKKEGFEKVYAFTLAAG